MNYSPSLVVEPFETGTYELIFFAGDYLRASGLAGEDPLFLDQIPIRFCMADPEAYYHVNLRKHLDAFIRVKDSFIAAPYPAWSCIGTTELITEGTLVEIRIICQRAGDT